MGDRIYKCSTEHIKAFPLGLQRRPTLEDYTRAGVEVSKGLIDFQWAPSSPARTTTRSTTGSILLQGADPSSSISTLIFNTLSYTITNVQVTLSQHSTWLIADPGQTNKEDLVLLLQANSPSKQELIYMIFVIPLLNTGSVEKDPDYLKNTNSPGDTLGSGEAVKSCFPTRTFPAARDTFPIFAHYVTCFDGYTTHARTQNIDVFVSTVGIPVSPATLGRIKADSIPGVIELPTTISNLYYIAPPGQGNIVTARITAATRVGSYADAGGVTLVSPTDFPNTITTAEFSTAVLSQTTFRTDSTDAYKCVELDPNDVDANDNIRIDMKNGKIASSTLDDILAEREVVKQLVVPNEETNPRIRENRKYYGFTLAVLIILGVFFGLYFFVFSTGTAGRRSFWEILLSSIIAITLLIAAGLGFLSGDTNLKEIGGWMALASGIAGFLFFLYFFVISPPPLTTECGKAADALAKGSASGAAAAVNAAVSGATATGTAPAEQKGWPAFFDSWKGKGIQIGITGAVFGLLGFIIGNII